MSLRPGQFILHPKAPESEWIALNPLLEKGEAGYATVVVNGISHVRKKQGPGRWNDLPWYDGVVWEDETPVANPIGDATGNIAGKTPIQILDSILNPYQAPVVSNGQNNAGTTIFAGTKRLEIGTSIVNPVTVRYSISNQANLSGTNPVTVTAGGRFDNEGVFPVGDVSLSHSGISPVTLDQIIISIRAAHQKGNTNTITTGIYFDPKIISVVGQTKPSTGSEIMALANKSFYITRDFTRDYSFGSAGYSIVAIPTMLNPSNLTFTDVTDPNLPAGYGMDDLGVMSINNGVATYNYQVYASTYYLLNPTTLRIS